MFIRRNGRIRSIEAPVVPKRLAMTAPKSRRMQLARGVAFRDTWMTMPPEMMYSAPSNTMKLTYSSM